MPDIFISYRREDSSGWAGRLSRDLSSRVGEDAVFEDISDIEPGIDFTRAIEQTLGHVDVLLAVIGPRWLSAADKRTGGRRLDDPADLVRREIATALKRNIRVVPVLVGGATIPAPEDLPEDLKDLAGRNAFEISDTRWDYDVTRLVAHLGLPGPGRPAPALGIADTATLKRAGIKRPAYAVGLAAALALLVYLGQALWTSSLLPWRSALDSLRLTVVDAEGDAARADYAYLADEGARLVFIRPDELSKLQRTKPDLVVVAEDTRGRWSTGNDPVTLKSVFENYKVVGIGRAGDELFRVLGLQLTGLMQSSESRVVVQDRTLVREPIAIRTQERAVDVYKASVSGGAVGIYDKGSPDIAGFTGLARWQSQRNHWPVARQGNFLFWGFATASGQLSDDGKALLANLLANHKAQAWMPLSKIGETVSSVRRDLTIVSPGEVTGVLNSLAPTSERHFTATRPGPITATLTWTSGSCPLSLILNGPGQVGFYARKDGPSPLSLDFAVTEEHIRKGSDWTISVTCFGNLGAAPLNYRLNLNFPVSG